MMDKASKSKMVECQSLRHHNSGGLIIINQNDKVDSPTLCSNELSIDNSIRTEGNCSVVKAVINLVALLVGI
eukprot:Pgem_evm1s9799